MPYYNLIKDTDKVETYEKRVIRKMVPNPGIAINEYNYELGTNLTLKNDKSTIPSCYKLEEWEKEEEEPFSAKMHTIETAKIYPVFEIPE